MKNLNAIGNKFSFAEKFMMMVVLSLVLLFSTEPAAFVFILSALCVLALMHRFVAVYNVYLCIIFSLFFWLYLAIVHSVDVYVSESYWPLVKAFLIVPLFFAVLKLFDFKLDFKIPGFLAFSIFVLLLLLSFLKGLLVSPFVSVAYLGNVYIPILLQFFLIASVAKLSLQNKTRDYHSTKGFTSLVCIILIVSSAFLLFDLLGVLQLREVFLSVGEALGRGGSEGNTRTHLFGVLFQRFPGLFADPILAAYTLFLFFTYAFCFVANPYIKAFMLCFSFMLGLVTLSKAFFFLLVCFFSFYFVCKLKLRVKLKFSVALIVLFFSVALIVIRALFTVVTDSSAVHVQGLVLPFISPTSGVAFLIGNDLGSGGNMGGWTLQGAESFVGLLMYNTGLIGVLLFFGAFFQIMYALLKSKKRSNYFLFCFFMSVISASFLQENSFNLGFSVVRIALLLFMVLYLLNASDKHAKI
ncbi:hypothetical protein [Pseudoalteromonas luteoviolacea]|uniref:O-antigen polymerase n=1 Tax=Pseudoalteromonas luteoviolacea S4060-1 TaxID=1365257 RepID=A0A167NLS8_9GAMM|nr:hypothetical protein [Pseudoalteromonas luteoviolacea]KZN68469.1 hypothetical protein N478_15000 [Pseudoalteromonas luteoviolacea S4060-1]